ncbi:hypothetical protein PybrP1_007981 [[Pythium] brassicae (nom. inval.)]|nr:hypothetical protein PybrP1_007981 [[Pythium] brassicae (nom. inval.)]
MGELEHHRCDSEVDELAQVVFQLERPPDRFRPLWDGALRRGGCDPRRVRVARHHRDAALAGSWAEVARQADVAALAPRWPPRVLDLPERLVALGAVAHDQHAVVELRAARLVEHAGLVELELALVGFDRDRHGLLRDRGLERLLVVRRHVHEPGDLDDLLARAALLNRGMVLVVTLGADAALRFDPLERVVHEPAVASVVAVVVAVHELLFRQVRQLAARDERGAFDSAGGGERPAGPALALVLHAGDSSLLDPVDALRRGRVVTEGIGGPRRVYVRSALLQVPSGHLKASLERCELVERQVRELVVAEREARTSALIVVTNEDVVRHERL